MSSPPPGTTRSRTVTQTIDAWLADARAHTQAHRFENAEEILAQLLRVQPDHAEVLHQAAIVAFMLKQPEAALARLEHALQLQPGQALFHRDICHMYRSQMRLDDALRHAEHAVALTPDDPGAHYNLGVILYDRMEIEAAIRAVRRTLALDDTLAEAHFELAEALLVSGQFEEGWQEYEWRRQLPGTPRLLPRNDRPLWDGRPLPQGALLLIGDQGFGDTIQFSRYLPLVAQRCPKLVVACSAQMHPIVMQQAGVTQAFDRWDRLPEFAAYCPLSSLPRLFETRLETIPAPIPYLAAEPERAAHWRTRLAQLAPPAYRRIGLVWAGQPSHGNDANRSLRLQQLAALAELPELVLVSLQMGPAQAEIGRYVGAAPLVDLGTEIQDFSDTMAILDGLDHLVTVDTAVAHLAGAMGVPVSILLPFAPDWRWLTARRDTPWYPSATLCRQHAPGQWQAALEAMLASLPPGGSRQK